METQTTLGSHLVTGMFADRNDAERAYDALQSRGYNGSDIHLVMSDETRTRYYGDDKRAEHGNKVMEGAGTGSAIGGTVGAIAGAVAAIGTSLLIPGLGLVVAGPLAAALAGAGAGGLTGGVVGALVGAGLPKDRAELYEKGLKEGNIVVGVQARNAAEAIEIEGEMRNHNAYNIHK